MWIFRSQTAPCGLNHKKRRHKASSLRCNLRFVGLITLQIKKKNTHNKYNYLFSTFLNRISSSISSAKKAFIRQMVMILEAYQPSRPLRICGLLRTPSFWIWMPRRNQLINILTETNKNLNPASSTLITTRKKNNKPVQFPIYWWTFFQRA